MHHNSTSRLVAGLRHDPLAELTAHPLAGLCGQGKWGWKGMDGVGRNGRQRVQEAKGEGRVEGGKDGEKGWDGKMREGKGDKE